MTRQTTVSHRKEIKLKNGHYYHTDRIALGTDHFRPIIQLLLTFHRMSNTLNDGVDPDDQYDTWRDAELTDHRPEREPQ